MSGSQMGDWRYSSTHSYLVHHIWMVGWTTRPLLSPRRDPSRHCMGCKMTVDALGNRRAFCRRQGSNFRLLSHVTFGLDTVPQAGLAFHYTSLVLQTVAQLSVRRLYVDNSLATHAAPFTRSYTPARGHTYRTLYTFVFRSLAVFQCSVSFVLILRFSSAQLRNVWLPHQNLCFAKHIQVTRIKS
jgi:hypothetical protein